MEEEVVGPSALRSCLVVGDVGMIVVGLLVVVLLVLNGGLGLMRPEDEK